MAFTCIELETRRRQLGLSQTDLGVCIGLLSPKDPADPRPVGQHTVSRWEEGVNGHDTPPYWVQDSLPEMIAEQVRRFDATKSRRTHLYEYFFKQPFHLSAS